MYAIKPNPKNLRTCITCLAAYCINGDESEYYCEISPLGKDGKFIHKLEGHCEFHRPNSKYFIGNKNK